MIKTKYLGILAIASSTLLFSGCIHTPDTFDGYYEQGYDRPNIHVSLVSYDYPYYYDRPYYFLNGFYYYGGFFRDGFYHYGNRRFRRGHYYNHGYRYYNGRRYRAQNGRYGYYKNRDYYQRTHHYRKLHRAKERRLDRGREYRSRDQRRDYGRDYDRRNAYYKKSRKGERISIQQHLGKKSHIHRSNMVKRAVRQRPVR